MRETFGGRGLLLPKWADAALITIALLATCVDSRVAASGLGSSPDRDPAGQLLDISERYLSLSQTNDDFLRSAEGAVERFLPDRSLKGIERLGNRARLLLDELCGIALLDLSHQDQLTAALLQRDLELLIEAPEHYWLSFDVTPYSGGYVLNVELARALNAIDLSAPGGVDHYLSLFTDSGRFIADLSNKLEKQRRRDILLPKAVIPRLRLIYSGLRENLEQLARIEPSRLEGLSLDQAQRLNRETSRIQHEIIFPALDHLMSVLGDDYLVQAPESLGLHQYPGGNAYYDYLIRRETSLTLTPDQIHQMGLEALATIQQEMQSVRQQLGFTGTAEEFHRKLEGEERFYASTPDEVERRYLAYIERIESHLPDYFLRVPQAPYGVKRASPLVEQGMTYGYYQGGAAGEKAFYYYNGSNLETRSLISAGFLIYHELIPGHHFHLALVRENQQLSAYRRGISMTAFSEGWANYAAFLAREIGMLSDPYDRYGWLLSNAYISVRLVVDTGLNHKGWSLQEASNYMLENTNADKSEVAAEVLRYSVDIPAQALSYKLGYDKIRELRQTAEIALGEDFDLREFHAEVLSSGTLALPVLERHIQWYIQQEINEGVRQ